MTENPKLQNTDHAETNHDQGRHNRSEENADQLDHATAPGDRQQSPRRQHSSRNCECPACEGNNGGLQFCSKCRYNGCTAGKVLCGGEAHE